MSTTPTHSERIERARRSTKILRLSAAIIREAIAADIRVGSIAPFLRTLPETAPEEGASWAKLAAAADVHWPSRQTREAVIALFTGEAQA